MAARKYSRQYQWAKQRIAEGRCALCGEKRQQYKRHCDDCMDKVREAQRRRIGVVAPRAIPNGPYKPRQKKGRRSHAS